MPKGPIKSTTAAKKARRLVTGSGRAGVPGPKGSGKPLTARENKKVAVKEVKNASSVRARANKTLERSLTPLTDPVNASANKRLGRAQVKGIESGASAKTLGKAVTKGYSVVNKRAKKVEKTEAKNTKKFMGMSKAASKATGGKNY